MVKPKLASEFEFPAPILQGTEKCSKTFVYSQLYEQILKYWSIVHEVKTESASI